ncbi:Serine/threonine-protein phosphatase with EF-hands 2 [Merluccius polli]|uniref:Serine/threonine-protein phosphatase n=1 Tax=Merluccius polli TaxID=89951 RepID=A0AA47MNB5_MERPO|nr:Serine/threonine-protein phosphatase with EF-hands 2 [Merluccius polli]
MTRGRHDDELADLGVSHGTDHRAHGLGVARDPVEEGDGEAQTGHHSILVLERLADQVLSGLPRSSQHGYLHLHSGSKCITTSSEGKKMIAEHSPSLPPTPTMTSRDLLLSTTSTTTNTTSSTSITTITTFTTSTSTSTTFTTFPTSTTTFTTSTTSFLFCLYNKATFYRRLVMGCGVSKSNQFHKQDTKAIKAAVLIQHWYRQYVARMEMKRRYTWNIFQSLEYSGEQAQIKLYNFLGYLMDNFTPSSNERNLISHFFRENEVCRDSEWERFFCYKNIEVPEIYSGPHLTFPLTVEQVTFLVDAFRNKRVGAPQGSLVVLLKLHSRYVLQLLLQTWKMLRMLPNISRISTCQSKEITICGDLHGQLEDLLLIFYKNGMPSLDRPYVFNGDFVDRGEDSIEILLILFSFLLLYPNDVHLNRGNHEDHIINLRYGFTKEVLTKYKMHGKRILKLLQKIFSWLPLATVIDQKVLVLHGGISDTTDLCVLARVDRHKYVSALRPPKKRHLSTTSMSVDSEDDAWSGASWRRASVTLHKPLTRGTFQNLSLQDFSDRVKLPAEEQLEARRRHLNLLHSACGQSQQELGVTAAAAAAAAAAEPAQDSAEVIHSIEEEWKQILDLLWSDPMTQPGCVPNEVRGGGCYWGPDVTEDFLSRHHLQLIVRSHECKQEGYEFCHNRKVLTLFSASNYYDVGSNRGAYLKLGPDLVPYLIQYQASSMTRELTVRQSAGRTEHSALRVLRKQLFSHKSDLICAFQELDKENTGLVSLNDWAMAVEGVMHLGLPWRMLHYQLISRKNSNGMVNYLQWFAELAIKEPNMDVSGLAFGKLRGRRRVALVAVSPLPPRSDFDHIEQSLLETLYRHRSTLETIFRIVDTDNSGVITMQDFRQTWKLLSVYLKMEFTEEAISDLAVSIDSNQDGSIDIHEFMEAFRLTDKKSRLERGRSMFMGTATDLTKLETGDPNV